MADGDLDATCQDAEDSLERIKRHQVSVDASGSLRIAGSHIQASVLERVRWALWFCRFLLRVAAKLCPIAPPRLPSRLDAASVATVGVSGILIMNCDSSPCVRLSEVAQHLRSTLY